MNSVIKSVLRSHSSELTQTVAYSSNTTNTWQLVNREAGMKCTGGPDRTTNLKMEGAISTIPYEGHPRKSWSHVWCVFSHHLFRNQNVGIGFDEKVPCELRNIRSSWSQQQHKVRQESKHVWPQRGAGFSVWLCTLRQFDQQLIRCSKNNTCLNLFEHVLWSSPATENILIREVSIGSRTCACKYADSIIYSISALTSILDYHCWSESQRYLLRLQILILG